MLRGEVIRSGHSKISEQKYINIHKIENVAVKILSAKGKRLLVDV